MKIFKTNISLDKIGFSASVLCALHCAFFPVLITLLPLLGLGFLTNNCVELLMVVLSVVIATIALSSSYKVHQKLLPVFLLFSGLIVIGVAHLYLPENLEPFALPGGGLTIATAHYFNWNYSKKCTHNHSSSTLNIIK